MADLQWDAPNTEEVEVDDETAAELERRLKNSGNGRYYSVEEVRKLIPQWISKFASQKPR